MYIGLHVKYRLFLAEFSRQIFEKYSNIKFKQNPFIGSRVVLRGRTDRRTVMTKLIVALLNIANAPKSGINILNIVVFSTVHGSQIKPTDCRCD